MTTPMRVLPCLPVVLSFGSRIRAREMAKLFLTSPSDTREGKGESVPAMSVYLLAATAR